MPLTDDQLHLLRIDLQRLAGIEYDDVLTELLDHYASLTEQHMTTGLSFDNASKWAWNDLGQGAGIQQIQDDYIANTQKQVNARHLAIVKGYFRWPAFLTTALAGSLVYLAVPLLPKLVVITAIWIVLALPSALMVWLSRRVSRQPASQRFVILKYMQQRGTQPINLVLIGSNFWGGFFDYSKQVTFLQLHSSLAIVACLMILLYTVSFVQLLNERFDFRTKIA